MSRSWSSSSNVPVRHSQGRRGRACVSLGLYSALPESPLIATGRQVSSECQGEMLDYRRMLMEDFSLSPEIILGCRTEIEHHCSGLHRKGRTLHCLMKVVRGEKGNLGDSCQHSVSLLWPGGEGRGSLHLPFPYLRVPVWCLLNVTILGISCLGSAHKAEQEPCPLKQPSL